MTTEKKKARGRALPAVARFFWPRAASFADDLRASTAGLAPPPESRWDRPRDEWSLWTLAKPVLHPLAPAAWASQAGVAAETISALQSGEVYVDRALGLTLFPWYADEDDAARPSAEPRARALGVAMPPRFLDEPFESSYYLLRTGSAALSAWLRARGIDADAGLIREIPMVTAASLEKGRARGLRPSSLVLQAARAVERNVQVMKPLIENGYEQLANERIDYALRRYVGAVLAEPKGAALRDPKGGLALVQRVTRGYDEAVVLAPEPQGPPQGEIPASKPPLRGVLAVDGGVVIVGEGALAHVSVEGEVRGVFPLAEYTRIANVRGSLVLLRAMSGALHLLDLARGEYREGPLAQYRHDAALGADLDPPLEIEAFELGPEAEARSTSADNAYRWYDDRDAGASILRVGDGVYVAEGDALQPLCEPSTRGARLSGAFADAVKMERFELGGITFEVSRSGAALVDAHDSAALAFTRRGEEWRFFSGNSLWSDLRPIARCEEVVHDASFTANGEVLWALGDAAAFRIDWSREKPVMERALLLEPLRLALAVQADGGRGAPEAAPARLEVRKPVGAA